MTNAKVSIALTKLHLHKLQSDEKKKAIIGSFGAEVFLAFYYSSLFKVKIICAVFFLY